MPDAHPILEAKFDYAFFCLDQNQSGMLDKDDFLLLAERLQDQQGWPADDARYVRLKASLLDFWEMLLMCVDEDGNGQVDRSEFKLFEHLMAAQVVEFGGQAPPWALELVLSLFAAVDSDGDGLVELDEYGQFLSVMGSTMDPSAAFYKLDLDGSGTIEMDELESLLVQYFTSTDVKDPGNYLLTGGWPALDS